MNIEELIAQLQEISDATNGEATVKMVFQPSHPMEAYIEGIHGADEEDAQVVYLGAGDLEYHSGSEYGN